MLTGQPRHTDAYRDLLLLAVADTHIYFNRLLELELAEAAYKIAIKEQFGNKRARDMRTDGRALRRASRLAGRLATAWTGVLSNFTGASSSSTRSRQTRHSSCNEDLPRMTPCTRRARSRSVSSTS